MTQTALKEEALKEGDTEKTATVFKLCMGEDTTIITHSAKSQLQNISLYPYGNTYKKMNISFQNLKGANLIVGGWRWTFRMDKSTRRKYQRF